MEFCTELRDRRRVSDERTFQAALRLLGERGSSIWSRRWS